MMEFVSNFAVHLLVSSLLVAVLCSLTGLLLNRIECSPSTQITLWILALLPGCVLTNYTIELPWLSTDEATVATATLSSNLFDDSVPISSFESNDQARLDSRLSMSELTITFVAFIWVAGFCFVTGRYIKNFLTASSTIRELPQSNNPAWVGELETVWRQSSLARTPKLLESAELGPMACFCNWQRAIIVPVPYLNQCRSVERIAILQHEVAHHQRGDCLISLAARLMCLFQWFNPAAWIAVRKIENCIELGCDDLVINHFQARRNDYARTLVSLVEFRQLETASGPMSIAAASPPIHKRIERIVQPKGFEMNISKRVALFLFAVLFLGALLRFELVAQQSETTKQTPISSAIVESAKAPIEETKQTKTAVPETQERLVTKTYSVANLLFPYRMTDWNGESRVVGGVTKKDFEVFSNVIKSTIRPEYWEKDEYTIQPFPPNLSLIISCPESCHQEVADLLKKLDELTDIQIHLEARVFVVPKDHVLEKRGEKEQAKGIGELVKAYRHFQKDAVATIELPSRTILNGQEVKVELPMENKFRFKPFRFVSTVGTDRKHVSCAAWMPAESPATQLINETVDAQIKPGEPKTVTPVAITWMSQHSIEHDGIQVFDVSEALETDRDVRKAYLVAYATIHVREEAE